MTLMSHLQLSNVQILTLHTLPSWHRMVFEGLLVSESAKGSWFSCSTLWTLGLISGYQAGWQAILPAPFIAFLPPWMLFASRPPSPGEIHLLTHRPCSDCGVIQDYKQRQYKRHQPMRRIQILPFLNNHLIGTWNLSMTCYLF